MLEVHDLHVRYGEIAATNGISLNVGQGEIVAVTGANGAGKSSTLNAVAGIVHPTSGSIRFDGQEMAACPSHECIRRGIVQVPEGRKIFGTLTVLENLQLGAYRLGSFQIDSAGVDEVLEQFPILADRLHVPASCLSGGQAQMLALARGLMAQPKLLLLDEPTLGLSPIAADDVFDLIRGLREIGLTILMVEQNVHQTLALADRAYVIEGGCVVLKGDARDVASASGLTSAYLGMADQSERISPSERSSPEEQEIIKTRTAENRDIFQNGNRI